MSQLRATALGRRNAARDQDDVFAAPKQCFGGLAHSRNHCSTTEYSRRAVPLLELLWQLNQCHPALTGFAKRVRSFGSQPIQNLGITSRKEKRPLIRFAHTGLKACATHPV